MLKKIAILSSFLFALALLPAPAQQAEDAEALKDRLYTQIIQAYNAKDWIEVNSLIQRIIDAGGDIDDLEITYAQVLAGLGREDDAIGRLEAYLATTPDDYQAFQVLGDIKAELGQTDAAIEAYQKCAAIRPDFARPWVAMGRLQHESDPAAAVENFNKAIAIFLRAKRPDAAIQIGMEAIKCGPENIQLLMLMGDALRQANMDDNALSFYAEVIALSNQQANPDIEAVVEADFSIAIICYRKHDYAKALGFLQAMFANEAVVASDPDTYAVALCLGAASAERLGNSALAAQYLDKAKTLAPDSAQTTYESYLALD